MAQGSRKASDSNPRTEGMSDWSRNPKQPIESQKVLFINRYSVDPTCKPHGPDRKTVGAHVQRAIRTKKRIDSSLKLRTSVLSEVFSRYRSRSVVQDEILTSSIQWSTFAENSLRLGPNVAIHRKLAQRTFTANDLKLGFSSRNPLEDQLEKASILLGTVQLRLSKLPGPLLGTGLFDIAMSGELSKSRPAKTVFQFCESAREYS